MLRVLRELRVRFLLRLPAAPKPPRAGVLNAEFRRNAEVPCDASRHAAERADHVNLWASFSRPENQPH